LAYFPSARRTPTLSNTPVLCQILPWCKINPDHPSMSSQILRSHGGCFLPGQLPLLEDRLWRWSSPWEVVPVIQQGVRHVLVLLIILPIRILLPPPVQALVIQSLLVSCGAIDSMQDIGWAFRLCLCLNLLRTAHNQTSQARSVRLGQSANEGTDIDILSSARWNCCYMKAVIYTRISV